jgi:hypothetical protein
MSRLAVALLMAGFTTLWASGCSESQPTFDIQFLASDLYFTIGGHHIIVPAFAGDAPDRAFDLNHRDSNLSPRDRLKKEARDPAKPAPAVSLHLRIKPYKGDYPELREVCALLKRKWSRAVCLTEQGGLLRRLPERFELLDRRKLDLLEHHWTVGKERQFDQVNGLALEPGITEIGCDKQTIFCTAAVEVLPGLLAIWTVWREEKTGTSARDMAESQGAAIVQLISRGLGRDEDPTLADAS